MFQRDAHLSEASAQEHKYTTGLTPTHTDPGASDDKKIKKEESKKNCIKALHPIHKYWYEN